MDLDNTMFFRAENKDDYSIQEILKEVYHALEDKGYDPVNQIVCYLLSGDPAYITSHQNARSIIKKVERDDIVEELVRHYLHI